jgi:hypothetical protein
MYTFKTFTPKYFLYIITPRKTSMKRIFKHMSRHCRVQSPSNVASCTTMLASNHHPETLQPLKCTIVPSKVVPFSVGTGVLSTVMLGHLLLLLLVLLLLLHL